MATGRRSPGSPQIAGFFGLHGWFWFPWPLLAPALAMHYRRASSVALSAVAHPAQVACPPAATRPERPSDIGRGRCLRDDRLEPHSLAGRCLSAVRCTRRGVGRNTINASGHKLVSCKACPLKILLDDNVREWRVIGEAGPEHAEWPRAYYLRQVYKRGLYGHSVEIQEGRDGAWASRQH